jgi:CheY-like chemotaxis protein
METVCQSIGLPYMTAVNGQEAVTKAQQFKFDLIFMDIQMPVMDGYTAIREIRKLEKAATTQIIALTASAFQDDVEKALGSGSTGFIAKPFERNQLLLCIAEHLGVEVQSQLRPLPDLHETSEEIAVRQMYDFMREQYQVSLGEIKRVVAQTLADWRPLLNDIIVFAKMENWEKVRAIMHRLKGQLGAIGLPHFAESAAVVNQRIKDGDLTGLLPLLEELVGQLSAIFRTLEKEVTLDAELRAQTVPESANPD